MRAIQCEQSEAWLAGGKGIAANMVIDESH